MFILTHLAGFGVGRGRPTISNTHNASTADNNTTYDFTSVDVGAAASNRYVAVVASASNGAGTDYPVSSMSILGNAASLLVAAANSGSGQGSNTEIWIAAVPTGTSGTVSVTWSNTHVRCNISVFALYNLQSAAARDTATSTSTGNPSLDVDVLDGGIVIAGLRGNNSPTHVWSGLSEDYENVTETVGFSSAHAGSLSAASPKAIAVTRSASSTAGAPTAVAVSLR